VSAKTVGCFRVRMAVIIRADEALLSPWDGCRAGAALRWLMGGLRR
jgi:hypothetical protein